MERNKRSIKLLVIYFSVFFTLYPYILYANEISIEVGDRAKNLRVIPPWTMRLCPNNFYATYNIEEAKKLKETDALCLLWKTKISLLEAQIVNFTTQVNNLHGIIDTYKEEQTQDNQRIQALLKQLSEEITEKNKYKYQQNYSGLYLAGGAALALIGIALGVGVVIAKK